VRHQNPDKFQFKFSAILSPPPEIIIGVRESLMLLNNHILKKIIMLKPSAEYNRRATIEGLHAGRSATEIIWFFGYPRSIVYNVVAYMRLYNSLMKIPVCQRGRVTRKSTPQELSQSLKGLKH